MEYDERASDAGQLLSFGLQPRLYPGKDPDYDALLARYCSDSRFRRLVDDTAMGLGLEVIYASHGEEGTGFYLRSLSTSPFAYTLSHFRPEGRMSETTTVKARGLAGLILVGIAAYFYPRAQSLAHEKHPTASAKNIDTFIRGLCEELRTQLESEPPSGEEGPEPAWKSYLREKEISQRSDGRRGQQGTIPLLEKMLEYLCGQGLMVKVHEKEQGTARPPHYQPLERFRQHILRSATVEVSDLFDLAGDYRIEQRRVEMGGQ